MYGKIHTELFDSSLMAEGGWLPAYIFMCMVTLSDKDGFLRHDPRTLYRRIGLQEDDRVTFGEFMDSIEYLASEDALSNLSERNGCRVIPVSELPDVEGNRGWLVVNKVHYRDKGGSLDERRRKDAERQRKLRERKNKGLQANPPKCHVTVTTRHDESAHTDTDTDTDTDKEKIKAIDMAVRFEDFWKVYPRKVKKARALSTWKTKRLDAHADKIIADVLARPKTDTSWRPDASGKTFIPHPTTYLNDRRWEDEISVTSEPSRHREL